MTEDIRISEETRARLDRYREAAGLDTDEEAIRHLLRRTAADSAFGSIRGWGSWAQDDRERFRSDDGGP